MCEHQKGIGFYVRVIDGQIEKKANAHLKKIGLTKTQADILRFLTVARARDESVKQRDLEEFYHISNPTVSGILDRLEQKDLIVRIKSEDDKRVRFIEPTAKGIEIEESMRQLFRETESEMMENISPELQKEGMLFLKAVLQNVMKESKGGSLC